MHADGSTDAPAVAFANSLGTDLHIWKDVVNQLDVPMRSVRYDMRGHGLTQPAQPPYSIQVRSFVQSLANA